MSYEVDSRTPYRADCACGKGFLRYYKISLSNEWFQTREDTTEVEICCVFCKEKYHYQCGYLVPKGLSFPSGYPQIDYKDRYNREEEIVQEYGKEGIEAIIGDMTAPKHTYIKNLTTEEACSFAQKWYRWTHKKKLAPMVSFLQNILKEFDSIKTSSDRKKVILDKFDKECIAYEEEEKRVKPWL